MQREVLLLEEMIDAAEQAHHLVAGVSVEELAGDRLHRDVLLWNVAVLGEASGQLSTDVKEQFPEVAWQQPVRLRNRIVHGYWSIDMEILHTTAQTQLAPSGCAVRSAAPSGDGCDHPGRGLARGQR